MSIARSDFHFSRVYRGDSFAVSLARHEHYLFMRLELKPGMRALEIGCQSGDAAFELAQFSNVTVVGVDSDPEKISRAIAVSQTAQADGVSFACDYGSLSSHFAPASFDAIYSIEGLRTVPKIHETMKSISLLLKPGGKLAIYDWCWTPSLDINSQDHRRLAHIIEEQAGVGHREIQERTIAGTIDAMVSANMTVLECGDLAAAESARNSNWYEPLEIALGSSTGPVSKGISRECATTLIYAGKHKLFTPLAFFVCQKPTRVQN
ncbi:sterol 24-C-methyltransferase [Coprinopsis cinerea okayama7|uniref:Sterol 24-C-methyltransferase n=1 Tax=Coprinopsis cinerea (strain Okayama-7 / 130 / ATCC MYA-4618 / FGSC 9003) TaxID=240176 RepID=A8P1N8_COPC7|nr:sterol 24-C-methyltransferase [Coprinopsis cinerea okayama7\|eukprot:XP_001838141.1 sterol 24-C-methyltransferase [Coprinopsis cinerea okayama7\